MIKLTVLAVVAVAAAESDHMTISRDERSRILKLGDTEWARFEAPVAGDTVEPEVAVSDAGGGWQRVRMTWRLPEPVEQDELSVWFQLGFEPDFWWAPHLAPQDGYIMAQHVFRSPAIIAAKGADTFVLIPDLDICGRNEAHPWFMDLDAPERACTLGLSRSRLAAHVLYRKAPGMTLGPGAVELGFFLTAYTDDGACPNPWARVTRFLWNRYGHPLFEQGRPGTAPLDRYVQHTYQWAFDTWKEAVWQEFNLNGKQVGSPCFIVNVSQSPNYTGEANLREFLSVWNQAWFSSLRAASGLLRYARRTNNTELEKRAHLTKELALAAPIKDGLFPTVYATAMKQVTIGDKKYNRSEGWETGHWRNSNRVPWERGITDRWYHVLDMSWTCLLMLRLYDELDPDPRLLEYARTYADKLLTLQDDAGFFPAWLEPDTLEPSDVLRDSPETSMSVTFLLKLAALTGDGPYRDAAIKAMDAVLEEIVPTGRWEDFETYWSCCQWGKRHQLGKKVARNGMYKQCNFSTFWTAEALLETYRATQDSRYLGWGRRTLDELSMTQQVWQPPFIYISALGGFGVMNCDGEWNDARQSLFCELFLEYYKETGDPHLFERGVAALKASFVMMYCPENPQVKALWEKVWPFFGPEDYGFMMENYGHGGQVSREGAGMGEFTIYTWGNGAAAEARNRVRDHFGDVYIDRPRKQAFGIDSIAVRTEGDGFVLKDLANVPRKVRVVFEDGSSRAVILDGEKAL